MLTPSRSQSSAMGSEGYFNWSESMERRQRKSERQMQALLCETRRLGEENEVLRIQVSSSGPPRNGQPRIPTIRCNARKARASDARHEGEPHVVTAQEACPGLSTGLSALSETIDDMLSTPFSPHIINYEPPRGFMIPKFSTYDGTNDPFDHIITTSKS
ncbi:hypothetical protein AAG906_021014 [Vitis piasezkii]